MWLKIETRFFLKTSLFFECCRFLYLSNTALRCLNHFPIYFAHSLECSWSQHILHPLFIDCWKEEILSYAYWWANIFRWHYKKEKTKKKAIMWVKPYQGRLSLKKNVSLICLLVFRLRWIILTCFERKHSIWTTLMFLSFSLSVFSHWYFTKTILLISLF